MASEKRLIDANALIAEYDRVHIGPAGGARKLMEDAPTVDAVEVVRCKDCKHYALFALACRNENFNGIIHMDGFCSYGERRTDD